jgi:putative ABC transport system permease protein
VRNAPPALANALLRRLLPEPLVEVVCGDLEEIWRTERPSRRRYWRLAVGSILACRRPRSVTARKHDPRTKGDGIMRVFSQDVGYGLRMMRRSPGLTAAILLTLALGIGVNAATFSLVDVLMWKPLHYRDPDRVAFVLGWSTAQRQMLFNLPLADALDIGKEARSFEDVAMYRYWSANLTGDDAPERVQAYRVTANTFPLLGTPALIGRYIEPTDGGPDAPDVVLLGYGLWQRRFGADPAVVGRTVILDGRSFVVIGVMPRAFEFPVFNFKGEAWAPLKLGPQSSARDDSPSIVAIARLRPNATYARAGAEVAAIMSRLEADHPRTNRGLGAHVVPMRGLIAEQGGPIAAVLMAAVGFVLLLACANIAHLLLSRGIARERELAVRAAIGAAPRRLARQLLTESLVLGTAGAGLGLLVASATLATMRAWLPDRLLTTMPNVLDLGVDRATLAFTLALGVGSALLFGAAPAWRAARGDLAPALKAGGRASDGGRHRRLRSTLMVAEVAISLVLLVAAGLLVRTFDRLQQVDPGFDADSVLTLTVSLPQYRYGAAADQRQFFETAAEKVARVPGVVSAAWVNVLPFSTYDRRTRYVIEGRGIEPGREASAGFRVVTPDYFRTLRIPVVAGRAFDVRDREAAPPVAIVNRALARREFGNDAAVGRRLRLGRADSEASSLTIVGVVGDVRHSEVAARPTAEIYLPFAQAPGPMMMLAARTAGDPRGARPSVVAAIAAVDASQPVYHVTTLRELVDAALLPNVAAMSMMTAFGALALLLAAVGVYGVVSYVVGQQTREIGVRLALGASPAEVLRLLLARGLSLIAIGALTGGVLAAAMARLMRGLLYDVTPADAPTYAVAVALLVGVGALACYLPARRAMRLDPVDVLRTE